jgi:pentatricopeptide repeat protein
MVGVFSLLLTLFGVSGMYGLIGTFFIQVWVFKYCYVLIEHLANGAREPPVMDTDMLSPLEIRPWVQVFIIVVGGGACYLLGGRAGAVLGVVLLALFPATVAILGVGERPWQAVNPVALYRVIRGLGPLYLAILAALVVIGALAWIVTLKLPLHIVGHALRLLLELSFYSLIGGAIFLRRSQLGFEPRSSPERTAARDENERIKLRARMIDDVFQQVRMGKYVDATAPLAHWLRDVDGELAARDSYYVAEQAVRWENAQALNTIGSTLIRHLLRAGRPDAALAVFEILRSRSAALTMDSAHDLRTLAEYAESTGRTELAEKMRLETPVFHPRT